MSRPNHIISHISTNDDGSVEITYYATIGGDNFATLDMDPSLRLISNTGFSRAEVHQANMEPQDGQFHILQTFYADIETARGSMEQVAGDTAIYHTMSNGMAFMVEIPYQTISTGNSSEDSDFKAEDPDTPVQYLATRGGATAFHGVGQATVNMMIRTAVSDTIGAEVANLVIQAACDALMDLDVKGVLGQVGNIADYPGVWTHTETDNPIKVGVAAGQANIEENAEKMFVNAMALVNIDIDLAAQNHLIIPCGLKDKPLLDVRTAGFSTTVDEFRVAWAKRLWPAISALHQP